MNYFLPILAHSAHYPPAPATSPRHSEHLPTSSKSPALTAPVKLVIVTSWRHFPHQTLESSILRVSAGIAAHRLAAGGGYFGVGLMGLRFLRCFFFKCG